MWVTVNGRLLVKWPGIYYITYPQSHQLAQHQLQVRFLTPILVNWVNVLFSDGIRTIKFPGWSRPNTLKYVFKKLVELNKLSNQPLMRAAAVGPIARPTAVSAHAKLVADKVNGVQLLTMVDYFPAPSLFKDLYAFQICLGVFYKLSADFRKPYTHQVLIRKLINL